MLRLADIRFRPLGLGVASFPVLTMLRTGQKLSQKDLALCARAGVSLVWGEISAGSAANVIPHSGTATGTVRVLDRDTWYAVGDLLPDLVSLVAEPYGVDVEVELTGAGSVVPTAQSLGGEDFAWYLEHVPGALGRLGTRRPGTSSPPDLHRGTFDVDERAIGVGVRVLAETVLTALASG